MEPSHSIKYLSFDDVRALHVDIMDRGGYPPQPLRAPGELESAVMRARTAAEYGGADLIGQAARLVTGISRAQAYLDGNKRTALHAADVFLRINGYAFRGRPMDMAEQLEGLARAGISPELADAEFEEWLRARVQPLA